jgi:hypothetical protein
MLTLDRLTAAIAAAAVKIAALDSSKAVELDAAMAIDFEEHFAFQTQQSTAHAEQLLATDAALLIYRSLGEVRHEPNGGWAAGTDTATKVVVTQLMSELLARRLKGRAA